ncbi:MltR family transcriptional regulator [Heyndrickxia sporothermodurans]
MASGSEKKKKRADKATKEPHRRADSFVEFLPELNSESDRGRALIACSYMDDLLKKALLAYFVNQEIGPKLVQGFSAPLGTFSTRTTAAYALGLISEKEFKEINTLREIRNKFAHQVQVSFDDQSISDLCKNLTMTAKEATNAKGRYTSAAVSLILTLSNRPKHISRRRGQPEEWPY